MTASRRFPPPWSIEERQACFIVKDGNGQALVYVYFEEEPGRRSAENLMSHDEAGALAVNGRRSPSVQDNIIQMKSVKNHKNHHYFNNLGPSHALQNSNANQMAMPHTCARLDRGP